MSKKMTIFGDKNGVFRIKLPQLVVDRNPQLTLANEAGLNFNMHPTQRNFKFFYDNIKKCGMLKMLSRMLNDDKEEAMDVFSETMVIVWKKHKQFKRSRAKYTTWVYAIARNKAFEHRRKNVLKKIAEYIDVDAPIQTAPRNVAIDISGLLDNIKDADSFEKVKIDVLKAHQAPAEKSVGSEDDLPCSNMAVMSFLHPGIPVAVTEIDIENRLAQLVLNAVYYMKSAKDRLCFMEHYGYTMLYRMKDRQCYPRAMKIFAEYEKYVDHTMKEISKKYKMTLTSVQSHLHHARLAIRKYINENADMAVAIYTGAII